MGNEGHWVRVQADSSRKIRMKIVISNHIMVIPVLRVAHSSKSQFPADQQHLGDGLWPVVIGTSDDIVGCQLPVAQTATRV